MSFETFSDFLNMGGHALYVWLCYGLGLFLLVLNLVLPVLSRRTLLRELWQRQRREQNDNVTTLASEPDNKQEIK